MVYKQMGHFSCSFSSLLLVNRSMFLFAEDALTHMSEWSCCCKSPLSCSLQGIDFHYPRARMWRWPVTTAVLVLLLAVHSVSVSCSLQGIHFHYPRATMWPWPVTTAVLVLLLAVHSVSVSSSLVEMSLVITKKHQQQQKARTMN